MNRIQSVRWTALLAVPLLAASPPFLAEDLHFPESSVDVGEVRCGAPLSHRFAFVNKSTAPIEIVEIRAGCGCMTPRLPQRICKPGESGALVLEVNTLSQVEGPHVWTCQVLCQGAGRRFEVGLQIAGRVIEEVTVRPAVLTIYTDTSADHELVLTDRRPKPLAIADVRSTSTHLNPRLIEQDKKEAGPLVRRIRLEVASNCPEGRHDETVSIYTDDPTYQELRVPVTIIKRARPRVTAAPTEVSLRAVGNPTALASLVRLRDSKSQPVIVDRVEPGDPAITCQWATGPDTDATLKVRVDGGRLSGAAFESTIQVHIRQPVQETIVIPIRVKLDER